MLFCECCYIDTVGILEELTGNGDLPNHTLRQKKKK